MCREGHILDAGGLGAAEKHPEVADLGETSLPVGAAHECLADAGYIAPCYDSAVLFHHSASPGCDALAAASGALALGVSKSARRCVVRAARLKLYKCLLAA